MKVKPVVDALERCGVSVGLVHTGQHYDKLMSDVFFEDIGLRSPDFHLGVGSGSHAEQSGRVMMAFESLLLEESPEMVIVVGDVNPTPACALVGAKAGVYVSHVEAGVRSRDWSMPEEINRVVTDRVSDLLLAPSHEAIENLRSEGCAKQRMVLTGNAMIDTLVSNRDRAILRGKVSELQLTAGKFALATLHRPANVDDPVVLRELVSAMTRLSESLPVVFPVHPRTAKGLANVPGTERLKLLPPLGYLDFLSLEAQAAVVITDSGGVQAETTALGVPCVTARDNTEWPITLSEGTNILAGRDPNRIVEIALQVIERPIARRCPALWDGHAGDRMAAAMLELLESPDSHPRPTAEG